jgi:glycolate oxidase FAD binding subunit
MVSSDPDVVTPADAAEVADVVRAAAGDGRTLLPRGAGTKSHWGGLTSKVDVVVETRRLRGVTDHEPGDLVATVGAGTSLHDLQGVLGLAGQRLALETGSPTATVGGVLATGEAGPLRLRYGTGRDLLIGVEFVRPDGVIARSGGRVVKNVAGYDIGKLLCGSYGTLGVMTSATFRLHPVPAARAWVSSPVASNADLPDLVARAMDPAVHPSAVEVDLVGGSGTLAVLIEGSATGVPVRAEAATRALGGRAAVGPEPRWWGQYPFLFDAIALKLAVAVGRLGTVLDALAGAAGSAAADLAVRGSAGAGVLYAALPGATSASQLDGILRAVRAAAGGVGHGSCVVLAAPASVRASVDVWGPVAGLDLMRRVKERFDPYGRMAAGRFVGGI